LPKQEVSTGSEGTPATIEELAAQILCYTRGPDAQAALQSVRNRIRDYLAQQTTTLNMERPENTEGHMSLFKRAVGE